MIILTVLNPHSTFKSKSCEGFYSVQLARTKNNLESRLCVTYRVLFSLGPWAMKTHPHPWGISTCLAVVTSLDLGNFGLKLWMSERVLTDKRVLLQHLEASQVMPVVFFFFFKKQQQKKLPANEGDVSSIPGSKRSPGEGNSDPLQSSCLESPMGRGAWWATAHGITKSRTPPKRLNTQVFHPLDGTLHVLVKLRLDSQCLSSTK